jgi:hypothetical protein
MFVRLAAAVDALDVPVSTDALAELLAIRDRLDAKVTAAVAAVDAAGLYEHDDALTMTGWLRSHGGRSCAAAARLAQTAKRTAQLPAVSAAWLDGSLSGGQVDAIVANLGRHAARFAEHEHEVLDVLLGLSSDDTAVAMRAWRAHADAVDDAADPDHDRDGTLHLSTGLDGTGILRGTLGSDAHEHLKTALRVADSHDRDRTLAERRAEALAEICRQFLDLQQTHRGGRHRPHVNVVVRYEDLVDDLADASYVDGPPIGRTSLAVLLCDSVIHRVLTDGASGILDYGRATRVIPVDLYNALVVRDQHCRYPGCDRPAHWCDGHHVEPWHHGGPTSLANLVLLCRRHHRRLHRPGFHAKLLPDATLEITRPDDTTSRSRPPPTSETPALRRPRAA